ncbi:SDR family oxidoreductase [Blastopirellula sp. JC732]|uniref:SDR family oxidoreductase n=1 Tax=Blastopirellula sediminis TaxID=2894196 RepID=A0A9X1MPR4_9BACT|nr:SDR family oxidoreductase [Blastopirellula sediminis]MCC9606035.1 SDR family oxidoreductase [Blastopirellula sediminis]MCC9630666.1 SDR family oxidoreductase [Blastopirellula sediminis]
MSFEINGKVALVTGANRGIGKAIVESLLAHGAKKVYAAVRDPQSAQPLVAQYGDRVVPIEVDLQNEATVHAAAQTASDVELVVNNAGVYKSESPLSPKAFDALQFEFDVNVYGLIRVAQAFAPVLKKNGGGAFVQLNSVVSIKTFGSAATYSASKAASYSITQALREELGAQGTVVVSVHPGPIATDMADAAGFGEIAEPASLVSEAIVDALKNEEFHVFPDSMAKQFYAGYENYAKNYIEANMAEA